MGASNPHPHCQIWASSSVPNEPGREQQAQHDYYKVHQSCLLCDYLALERERRERLVCENQLFTALIPFWAVWPFETMVLARRHLGALPELSSEERGALADILKRLTTCYDNLFQVSFPYSMGFHQQPTDKVSYPGTYMRISIRRCCVPRRFGSSWWDMRCSERRNATSQLKRRQSACGG